MEEQLLHAATQNFNLPHDVVTLPTGGIFYKSKKKSVKVGYLTAQDENILVNSVSNTRESIVMNLLKNKIYEHDLRPEELLDSDIQAILIFLRNTSFGPEYNINLIDPKTQKQFTTSIVLDELNIKKTNSKPNEDGLFETKLPRSGFSVKLKPLTFAEDIELSDMAENYPKNLVAPRITWRLNKHVVELDGNTDRGFISSNIEKLPIADSKYIRSFLNENVPSLDLNRTVISPSGERISFEISFGVEFFRPFF